MSSSVAGRRTVLVHHQTGIAAITVTTLGYQVSHLAEAKVPSPVSGYIVPTTNTCQTVFPLPLAEQYSRIQFQFVPLIPEHTASITSSSVEAI